MNAERRALLAETLGAGAGAAALAAAIAGAGDRGAYLARAVLTARIPTERQVADDRLAFLIDADAALAGIERDARRAPGRVRRMPVRLVDGIVIDVTDSAGAAFTSGIQRVSRGVLRAWAGEVPFTPVVLTPAGVLRSATPEESERAGAPRDAGGPATALVPLGARLFLPEIATAEGRAARLAAIARHGSVESLAIGHDCIPMTTAESAPEGMPAAFADYLAGVARFRRIAATSAASAAEFRGWAAMLPAAGLTPPEVLRVGLPVVPIAAAPEPEASIRAALRLGDAPIVLVVGTHEPRKNHLAVLAAAELAWRGGAAFSLVMVGARSWEAKPFDAAVRRAERAGRPLVVLTGAPDSRLAGLYRAAVASVFVSFNEGFGLPVAESLAAGTPVITADFGSQREIGEGRGAILVDPREPRAIAAAILDVLADPAAARARVTAPPPRGWAQYAAELRELLG